MNLTLGNNIKTWNAVIALTLVAFVALVVVDRVVPLPRAVDMHKKQTAELRKLQIQVSDAQTELDAGDPSGRLVWSVPMESVTPALLSKVNSVAGGHKVKVKAFRPQKSETKEDIVRLPYLVIAEGSFTQVASFVRSLESGSLKAGVSQVQISAQGGDSDMVNATVGLVAYTKLKGKK